MDLAADAIETLKNAPFPVYAVPPSEWPGYIMVGRVMGTSKHVGSIGIRYDDDPIEEQPRRRIEIVSTGPEVFADGFPQMRNLASEFSYPNEIINFTHPFTELEERPVPGSERFNADLVDGMMIPKTVFVKSAGPRRLGKPRPFKEGREIEPVSFEEYPDLLCYRIQMRDVEVFGMSWGYSDGYVSEQLAKLRPIKHDPQLFAEIERAEYAAWDRILQRKDWKND